MTIFLIKKDELGITVIKGVRSISYANNVYTVVTSDDTVYYNSLIYLIQISVLRED